LTGIDYRELLRRASVGDDQFVGRVLAHNTVVVGGAGVDARTAALIRVGALVALDAHLPSYLSAVEAAWAAGAMPEQVVGALLAVTPLVGTSRAVSAAPTLGLALGYDVSSALEEFDPRL
jgi:alkylhydroperoxidase/carboxymuconolactone decarboxylase family protein YurZ